MKVAVSPSLPLQNTDQELQKMSNKRQPVEFTGRIALSISDPHENAGSVLFKVLFLHHSAVAMPRNLTQPVPPLR